MSTVSYALRDAPLAVTVTLAEPSPVPLRANLTTVSPAPSNWAVVEADPSIWSGPSTFTVTCADLIWSSRANTFTGSTISSPVHTCLGRLMSTIRGDLTATVRDALPYAPSWPATTITRRLPTYIGNWISWESVPLFRVKGPRNCTTGLNLLSLRAATMFSWSPPIESIGPKRPANAPTTWS